MLDDRLPYKFPYALWWEEEWNDPGRHSTKGWSLLRPMQPYPELY